MENKPKTITESIDNVLEQIDSISENTLNCIYKSIKNIDKQGPNFEAMFYDWWENGCRSGEKEPHGFLKDFPSDAWLAKEAWWAAIEAMKQFNDIKE
jgi:hypothetical protein